MAPTHQRLKLAWNFFFFFFFVLSINKWSSSSTYAVSLKFFCIAIYYRSFRDSLVRSLAYAEHNNEMFKFIFQHFLFLLSARAIPWAVLWLFLSFFLSCLLSSIFLRELLSVTLLIHWIATLCSHQTFAELAELFFSTSLLLPILISTVCIQFRFNLLQFGFVCCPS